ncbi:DUF4175 domain-containing protein [Hyphomonas sp. WL0036]|uniref:DUF4175 domain-containing protein n=1 Tax=Hyphomonas sediminis TaxID=2866160 RepID=UPI001C7EA985|nr:DUF4175 family protein [Hyphomonas sediminis]MBY9065820.1 DUF4175 domain-containing protein [Hyphomonas sediminis]
MDQDEGLNTLGKKLAATRRRLTLLALGRACWPAFVFIGFFLAIALAGGFDRLSNFLAAAILPVLILAGIGLATFSWRRYSKPSEDEVTRALDGQSELRPVSSLTDRPADPSAVPASLWRVHKARLIAEIGNLRLPSLKREWTALDPYRLRFVVPVAVIALALIAGPAGPGRIMRALSPDLGALAGADKMVVEAWVTPPEYTGRAPIFLQAGMKDVRIPVGSEVTLRTQAPSAPKLVLRGDKRKTKRFSKTPEGAYEARARIESDTRLTVNWWGERARWNFSILPDEAPLIAFDTLPEPGPRDQVQFKWKADDDYGVVAVELAIRLREPHPADPEAEDRVPVPMPGAAGAKEAAAAAQLDLTRHRWAGLPVDVRLVARDGSGQEGFSESIPFILPEKLFLDPLAKATQEARVTVLREPRSYAELEKNGQALTDGAINTAAAGRLDSAPEGVRQAALMLDALTYRGEMFFNDLGAFMGLRMALGTLQSAGTKAEADAVEPLLWSIALKLEYGSVADARARLEAARAALERALREGAPEEEIRRLMEAFRDAANEYLAAKMAEAMAGGLDAPEQQEDSEAQAGGDSLGGQDFEDMLNALQDLTETGASEQARQLLSDITNMLQNLEFQRGQGDGNGMPGMPGEQAEGEESDLPPEEQAMTDAMRRLSEILREQRQLNDDTLAQQRGEEPRGNSNNQPNGQQQPGEGSQQGEGGDMEGEGTGQGERPGEDGGGVREGEGESGSGRGGTLAERQAELGKLVEELARRGGRSGEDGEEGASVPGAGLDEETLRSILDAQRRAERSLQGGNEGRAIMDQERATQMLSELSREMARQIDEMRSARLGQQGQNSNDPLGRPLTGAGNDGEGIDIPSESERQRAKDILEELRRRYGEAEDEEEREYLRRLLERF